MVGPDVASTDHKRPAGVAEFFHRNEDGVSTASSEISAVLKSDPTRSALSDNTDDFEDEAAALAFDARAIGVGAGDVLAGIGGDEKFGKSSNVGSHLVRCERPDVVIDFHSGVVLGIEGAAPFDPFAGGHGLEARAVQAERPASCGGAEQVEHPHPSSPSRRWMGSALRRAFPIASLAICATTARFGAASFSA